MGWNEEKRLQRRVQRYLVFRFAVVLLALGLIAVYQVGVEVDQREPEFQFLYWHTGGYLLLGLLSLAAPRAWFQRRSFIFAQVALDFVERLRGMVRFDTPEQLVAQMHNGGWMTSSNSRPSFDSM